MGVAGHFLDSLLTRSKAAVKSYATVIFLITYFLDSILELIFHGLLQIRAGCSLRDLNSWSFRRISFRRRLTFSALFVSCRHPLNVTFCLVIRCISFSASLWEA